MGIIAFNLLSLYISTANGLLLATTIVFFLLLVPNFIYLFESPTWLVRQKRYSEAVDVFKDIAKMNGRHVPKLYFEKFAEALESNMLVSAKNDLVKKMNLWQKVCCLFGMKKYLYPLIIMSTISTSLYCVYYGMITSIQDLGLEKVQFNGVLAGLTQGIGFAIILPFLPKRSRKQSLVLIQSVLLLGAFLLVCMSYLVKSEAVKLAESMVSTLLMSTTLACLFSFMYVTNTEIFPTQLRGFAVGFILLTGKLIGSLAPYINYFSKIMEVHVLVGSSFPLFLSIYLTLFLQDTNQEAAEAKKMG